MARLLLITGFAVTLLVGSGCHGIFKKNEDRVVVSADPHATGPYVPCLETIEKLQKAEHQFEKGHLAKSEELLNEVLAVEPECGLAHNQLGILYLRRCDLYRAAIEFDKAIDLLPLDPEPQNNLGMTLEKAQRYPQAIIHYETAYTLAPTNPAILGNLIRARLLVDEADPGVKLLLQDLLMIETRPEWRAWVEEELALIQPLVHGQRNATLTPPAPPKPAVPPLPEPPPLQPLMTPPPSPAGEAFPWAEGTN